MGGEEREREKLRAVVSDWEEDCRYNSFSRMSSSVRPENHFIFLEGENNHENPARMGWDGRERKGGFNSKEAAPREQCK